MNRSRAVFAIVHFVSVACTCFLAYITLMVATGAHLRFILFKSEDTPGVWEETYIRFCAQLSREMLTPFVWIRVPPGSLLDDHAFLLVGLCWGVLLYLPFFAFMAYHRRGARLRRL